MNAQLNPTQISGDWNRLSLAPSTLSTLALLLKLPSTTPQVITDFLSIQPQGSFAFIPQAEGLQGNLSFAAPSGEASTNLAIANSELAIQAKAAAVFSQYCLSRTTLEGEIISASGLLAITDTGMVPQRISLTTTPVSGSQGDWAGSSASVKVSAEFSQNEQGQLIPKSAEIHLDQLSGSHRGYLAKIPGLNLRITQQGAEEWLNELRIPSVAGHLSANLISPNWSTAVPETGEFFANGFDIATALRSVSLRDSSGTPRSLLIPEDLTAQLDGALRIDEVEDGYRLNLGRANSARSAGCHGLMPRR